MLPGFRFLFAAIVLSMSVLVFGLGAAALLQAAHEQFASLPSRQAPPETVFAQPSETPAPTLALLRVEPPVEEKAPDNVAAAAPVEQPADAAPPAEPEKLAALKPEDTPPPEAAKPDVSIAETTPAMPAAPAQTETPASSDEPKLAAIADTSPPVAETPPPATETAPPVTETASAASEQPAVVPSPETSIAATRIATLGGPAVTIDQATAAKADAALDRSAAGKRAQRARERWRIARRARLARQAVARPAAAQPQANPFAQPAVTPRAR